MSFPDSASVARAESIRLDSLDWTHHEDCPQHPWNDVFDETDPCECGELRAADASDAAESRADSRRES